MYMYMYRYIQLQTSLYNDTGTYIYVYIYIIEGKSFIFPDAWTSKHTVNDIHIHCMYRSAGNTHTMIQHLQSDLACLEKCACVFS